MAERLQKGAKLTQAGDVNLTTKVGRGFKEVLESMGINYRAAEKDAKTDELNWERYGDQLIKEEIKTREIKRETDAKEAERQKQVDDADIQLQIDSIEGINTQIELEAYRANEEAQEYKRKEQHDKEVEKAQKRMAGETGFRGLIKATKEGWHNLLTQEINLFDKFDDVKDSFSSDMDFLSNAMAPLQAIPGVSTLMSVLKFILIAGFKYIRQFFSWLKGFFNKQERAKRLDKLKKGKQDAYDSIADTEEGEAGFGRALIAGISRIGGFVLGLVVGLGAAIGAFFGKITAPFRTGGTIWKMFGSPKWVTKVGDWFGKIFGKGGKIAGFFTKIRGMIPEKLIKILSNVGKLTGLSAGASTFSSVVRAIQTFGATLGKFFWPITLVLGAVEAIKGFIKGIGDTEGGIFERITGGLYGAVGQLIDWLIMWPADLLTNMIAWIGDKMGFDTTAIKDFSFSDLWNDIWSKFTDGMLKILRIFTALGKASGAAVLALGGKILSLGMAEGPIDAFKRVYAEEMAKPVGSKSVAAASASAAAGGGGSGGAGEAIINSNRVQEELEKTLGESSGPGPVAIDQSTTINTTGDQIHLSDTEPADGWGSRFASWRANRN